MEIVVSVIILALMVVGITALFISAKTHIFHSRARMTGGELGKLFLDPLAFDVAADTWGTGNLRTGGRTGATQTVGNVIFTPTYTVSDYDVSIPGQSMRKVQVDVQWQETPP